MDSAREYAAAIAALRAGGAPAGEVIPGPSVQLRPGPTDAEDPAYLVRGILEEGGLLDVADELAGGTAVASRVVPTTGGIVLHLVEPGAGTAARPWISATDIEQAAVAGDTSGVAGWTLSFRHPPAVMHPYPRRFRFTNTGALSALFRAWAYSPAGLAGTPRMPYAATESRPPPARYHNGGEPARGYTVTSSCTPRHETPMIIVICGSISIRQLPREARFRIGTIISLNAQVVVGDAFGVDLEVQQELKMRGFRNVVVYHRGAGPRNNVGDCRP